MTTLPPPLGGEPPEEVPLPQAPLVRVVAQIRFPPILAIGTPQRVADFQETIRSVYPILREERVPQLMFPAPGAVPSIGGALIWRFHDQEPRWRWRASLAIDYLALETRNYTSREDFMSRLRVVVSALEKSFNPREAQRLGVRYIDRLAGEGYDRVTDFFRSAVLGITQTELRPAAQQIVMQAVLDTEEGQILARWGQLPAKVTVEPDIDMIDAPSWILDLDMFTPSAQKFETDELLAKAERFAKRIYSVFRWMVNDEFLRFHRGQI
jgi:uncharacterized protein (TIGR04255 family)